VNIKAPAKTPASIKSATHPCDTLANLIFIVNDFCYILSMSYVRSIASAVRLTLSLPDYDVMSDVDVMSYSSFAFRSEMK